MCALPLPEVLCDFEDSVKNIRMDPCKNDNIVKEICLVADSLRLGGAILKFYPGMLSAQLVVCFNMKKYQFPTLLSIR